MKGFIWLPPKKYGLGVSETLRDSHILMDFQTSGFRFPKGSPSVTLVSWVSRDAVIPVNPMWKSNWKVNFWKQVYSNYHYGENFWALLIHGYISNIFLSWKMLIHEGALIANSSRLNRNWRCYSASQYNKSLNQYLLVFQPIWKKVWNDIETTT